jgi:hypothetical protein
MKFKGTWVLALLAIALGLYVYFIEIKKAAKDEEQKTQDEKVLNFEPSKVKAFEIKNPHGDFVMEKDGTTWKLTKPMATLADEATISGILNDLSTEKFEQTIEGEDLKQYGLDNPATIATVTLQDGAIKKVAQGADAALPGKIYLLRNDEKKVLFANAGIKYQLDKTQKDLRDKRIFHKAKDDIQHLTFKVSTKDFKGQVALTKKDGNTWGIDGTDENADQEAVKNVLTGIDNFKASDFPSEKADEKSSLKEFGLNQPVLDLEIDGKDNAVLAHILAAKSKDNSKGYVIVEGEPTVYQVFPSSIDPLTKKSQDFRDKKLPFTFKKDDVADILAKNSTSEIHVVKKGSSWEMPIADPSKDVSQIQISNFLTKVSDLKVAEYTPGEKAKGLNPPAGEIVLKDDKGNLLLDFSWGDRAKNQRNLYATTDKFKKGFTVDSGTILSIPIQTIIETKATPTPAPTSAPTPKAAKAP